MILCGQLRQRPSQCNSANTTLKYKSVLHHCSVSSVKYWLFTEPFQFHGQCSQLSCFFPMTLICLDKILPYTLAAHVSIEMLRPVWTTCFPHQDVFCWICINIISLSTSIHPGHEEEIIAPQTLNIIHVHQKEAPTPVPHRREDSPY